MPDKPFFPDIITDLPGIEHNIERLEAYLMQGEKHQIIFMSFEEDFEIPEHSHEAQWAVVLDGSIELTIGGNTFKFSRGDTYYIPKNIKHSAVIQKGYKDITLFNQADRFGAQNKNGES